jgi:hypothetical protein
MPDVRVTQDVDVIVEITSRREYYRLEKELRGKGFKQVGYKHSGLRKKLDIFLK